MPRLLIASPHRYPDLARLWHRVVTRELVPAIGARMEIDVNIFCDANAEQFNANLYPGIRFSRSGPGQRDFMEFYDATLGMPYDFVLFLDADTFLLDGNWVCSYLHAFDDPNVAAISFIPRKGLPAIFALLCRVKSYRTIPSPIFPCRCEFPANWPNGINLEPGDFAVRELRKRGQRIITVPAEEAQQHTANFRGTTGIRSSREHITHAAGEEMFFRIIGEYHAYLAAAYDNVLLSCLYESLYHEPFAAGAAGASLGGSLVLADLLQALQDIPDAKHLESLSKKFQQSRDNFRRLAAWEGVELSVPCLLQGEVPRLTLSVPTGTQRRDGFGTTIV